MLESFGRMFCGLMTKVELTDQGTTLMSLTRSKLYGLLVTKSICPSVHHPQKNGLLERLTQMHKNVIRKFVHNDA